MAAYKQLLLDVIREKNLQNMYSPNDPALDRIAYQASAKVDQLCAKWRVPREVGQDIAKLGLFDIVLYIGLIKVLVSVQNYKLTIVR